ncbi:MAG TPA: hypothetical protein VMN77_03880 [Nitrospiria bacterium]|jgi:hypothetical protein|nr:hypothetical protein [Nitrospiria bacterium]
MSRLFKTAATLPWVFIIAFSIGLGGCKSTPPAPPGRPDSDKIQKDSEKGMQDLEKEEDRRGTGGY